MKKFKNKKTNQIWGAICNEHIKYFKNNPDYVEVKDKTNKVSKTEVENNSTEEKNIDSNK